MDVNVERVTHKYLSRAAAGLKKYGVDTTRDDLDLIDWLNHLQEELMDATIYIEAALCRLQKLSVDSSQP